GTLEHHGANLEIRTEHGIARGLAAGDFNGDGLSDLAAAGGGIVLVFLNHGGASLGLNNGKTGYNERQVPDFMIDNLDSHETRLLTADFNGDGELDLAMA